MKNILLSIFVIASVAKQSHSQGTWTQKASFGGTSRNGAVGFSIGFKGYIGMGMDSTLNEPNDFWEWNQITNVWTQKASFVGAERWCAVGFSIGTKGYIGTGQSGISPFDDLQDFWEWDQNTNVWTQKANFGGAVRESAVGFSIGAKGYIGTGWKFNAPTAFYNDFWEWDQATNVWTQKANFAGVAREGAVGFSIGTKGYIGTGDTCYQCNTKDFWEWNQTTNVWTQKANFGGIRRTYAVGFSIGSKGYIGVGERDSIGVTNDFWEWNQATNIWTQKANFGGTMPRSWAVGFLVGVKGYIGTGGTQGNYTKDFWEYCDACSASAVNEIDLSNLVSIYPNPTSGKVNMQISQFENLKIKKIIIYDSNGKKVFDNTDFQINSSSNFQIDLNSQPSGIYFLHLKTNEGPDSYREVIKKIVKE